MTQDKTATVLGGGSWGTALAHVVASHGYKTLLWMRDEKVAKVINKTHRNPRYLSQFALHEGIEATTDLPLAAGFAETIIVAIPSKAMRKVAFNLGHHVSGDQILLSATKGLEVETLTRMSQILREETCIRKIGALSGPNLAAEVMLGHPSATVVASRYEEVVNAAELLLAGPRFRLYGNLDIVGVELAGALKNVIAIAAGISSGLGFGANTLSLLLTRGLAEIRRMGERLGAERDTFQGLAGFGDLVATCTSPLSRNHTVGRRLAGGETLEEIRADMHMVAEGVNTTAAVCRHARRLGVDMPIAAGMHQLLFEGAVLEEVIHDLMTRISVYEASYSAIHTPATLTTSIVEHAARVSAQREESE
jgi:glycerol-3-phosphate dehydrogenase (NAD(P)+)